MDFPPQPGEKLPILPFRQMELPGQVAGLVHRPGAGSVHRRQPFGQKGNRLAFFCGPFVRFQLLLEERNCLFFTRSAQQFQQIIIPAIVRHQGQIFLGCFRGKKGQPMEDDPEHPPFSQAPPDIPGKEQGLQGQVPVLPIGRLEKPEDFPFGTVAQSTDRSKQIQARRACAGISQGPVLRSGPIDFFLQQSCHDDSPFHPCQGTLPPGEGLPEQLSSPGRLSAIAVSEIEKRCRYLSRHVFHNDLGNVGCPCLPKHQKVQDPSRRHLKSAQTHFHTCFCCRCFRWFHSTGKSLFHHGKKGTNDVRYRSYLCCLSSRSLIFCTSPGGSTAFRKGPKARIRISSSVSSGL